MPLDLIFLPIEGLGQVSQYRNPDPGSRKGIGRREPGGEVFVKGIYIGSVQGISNQDLLPQE